jgi:hypothetical protein
MQNIGNLEKVKKMMTTYLFKNNGHMVERIGRNLQNSQQQFDSACDLKIFRYLKTAFWLFFDILIIFLLIRDCLSL